MFIEYPTPVQTIIRALWVAYVSNGKWSDVCTGSNMFPDGDVFPVTLRQWAHTNTALESCTIRGVDWEALKDCNLCKSNGVRVSSLTDEDTVKIVLKFDLVKTNDWMQLEKASGIRTNTFALEAMRQRCTDVTLRCPDLEARGLPTLRAELRSITPDAPRSVTGTIDRLEMHIDPTS